MSRHFYELDELHAALAYASTRNDRFETVFWCQELLNSGCVSETISTLFEAWLWQKGPFSLSWLGDTLAGEEVTEEDVLLAAYQLSWISHERRDHSLWNILVLTASSAVPDRVTPLTPPYVPHECNEVFFCRALFQGKAYSAWWMSRRFSDARVWELLRWYVIHNCPVYADRYLVCFQRLQSYESLLGYTSPEYDVIVRCFAVLSVCLNDEQREESWRTLPLEMGRHDVMAEWKTQLGNMAYRRYTIPTACLYGKTLRGRMKWSESTVSRLGCIEAFDCPFWEEARRAYDLSTDDGREDFYERYDVPDEWSKSEKQKSHGDGLLGPHERVTLSRYSRTFLSHDARLAWNARKTVEQFLEGKEGDVTDVVHWFPSVTEADVSPAMLTPVRRILVAFASERGEPLSQK